MAATELGSDTQDQHEIDLVENMVERWATSEDHELGDVEMHSTMAGHEVLVLHNVFTLDELEEWLQLSRTIKYSEAHVQRAVRNCERVVFSSPALARLMWSRCEAALRSKSALLQQSISKDQAGDFGMSSDGEWEATDLNTLFRLCRYPASGHFAPHTDSSYLESTERRSLLTFMAYLTGDFQGGCTEFLKPEAQLSADPSSAELRYHCAERDVEWRLQPAAGSVVVFLQCCVLHGGQPVQHQSPDGAPSQDPLFPKHILRTDVMFNRKAGTATELTDRQRQAREALLEAQTLEADGEHERAITAYQRATRLDPDLRI